MKWKRCYYCGEAYVDTYEGWVFDKHGRRWCKPCRSRVMDDYKRPSEARR